jgi:hypothetical protein
MNALRYWLQRRVGRRNLPFLLAVLMLMIVVAVLMILSPRTESANDPRTPVVSGG